MSAHPCTSCFFFETAGVCPAAQDAYGLETPAEIQRRAEELRAAIATDAHAARSFYELIQVEAQAVVPAAGPPLALPAASVTPETNSRKESVNASKVSTGTV